MAGEEIVHGRNIKAMQWVDRNCTIHLRRQPHDFALFSGHPPAQPTNFADQRETIWMQKLLRTHLGRQRCSFHQSTLKLNCCLKPIHFFLVRTEKKSAIPAVNLCIVTALSSNTIISTFYKPTCIIKSRSDGIQRSSTPLVDYLHSDPFDTKDQEASEKTNNASSDWNYKFQNKFELAMCWN